MQSTIALMTKINLCLRSSSFIIYNIFYAFNPFAGSTITGGTIVFVSGLDTWISTVGQDLTTKNMRCSTGQEQDREVLRRVVQLATFKIIGIVLSFNYYWFLRNFYRKLWVTFQSAKITGFYNGRICN